MRRTLPLTLLAALAACTPTPPAPPEEIAVAPATSVSARMRKHDTLRALVRAGDPALAASLTPALEESMQRALTAHTRSFQYQPDTRRKIDPGQPRTRSFIEDDWTVHQSLETTFGATAYQPACALEPCTLRLDLDGVGPPDTVVSAWDVRAKKLTFAVASSRPAMIGAQVGSLDLTQDARWRVVAAGELAAPGFTRRGVLIEAGTVRHLLYQDATAVRLIRL